MEERIANPSDDPTSNYVDIYIQEMENQKNNKGKDKETSFTSKSSIKILIFVSLFLSDKRLIKIKIKNHNKRFFFPLENRLIASLVDIFEAGSHTTDNAIGKNV